MATYNILLSLLSLTVFAPSALTVWAAGGRVELLYLLGDMTTTTAAKETWVSEMQWCGRPQLRISRTQDLALPDTIHPHTPHTAP